MRKVQFTLSLSLLVVACELPPEADSTRSKTCDVDVSFSKDAVSIDTCTDEVSVEAVYRDGARSSSDYETHTILLPQDASNPIVKLVIDDGEQLGLEYLPPDLEPDVIPVDPDPEPEPEPEPEPDPDPEPEFCEDDDQDGVPNHYDCDDANPLVGALLYANYFNDDDGYLEVGPKLLDPWHYDGEAHNSGGGQQALLGRAKPWAGTVTFGSLRVSDIQRTCGNDCEEDNTRFRAGFLARTNEDADQDEGFHGYRCAVARNSGEDCFDPGPFVQIAAFLDGPEDDYNSECFGGCPPNPTFDQLARVERSEDTNFIEGDSGELVFWAVGDQLRCEFYGENDEVVVAEAQDERFATGTTGMSTLNALSDFEYIKVCEAFGTP